MEDHGNKVRVCNADPNVIRKLNSNLNNLGDVCELLGESIQKSKLVKLMFGKYVKKAVQGYIFKEVQVDCDACMQHEFVIGDMVQNIKEDHKQNVERNGGCEILDGRQQVQSFFLAQKCYDNVKSSEEGADHIVDGMLKTKSFGNVLVKLPWEWEIYRDTIAYSCEAFQS